MFDHGPGDVRFFDRVAPLYDRVMPPADRDALDRGLSLARRPVGTVLDVAGGTGRAARALSQRLDPDETRHGVVVLDQSMEMLRVAAGRDSGLDCVAADAGALPIGDGTVDAVTVVDALHHVPNQRALVEEARRVLAPGGVLVIADFDPTTLRGRVLAGVERLVGFDSVFTTPDDLARFLTYEGFTARVVEAGFGYVVAGRVD